MCKKLMILKFQCLAVGKRDIVEYEQGERKFFDNMPEGYIYHSFKYMYSHDSNQSTIHVV